jgi:acetyl-CoA carboxylase carboxyl transferase subunit beta
LPYVFQRADFGLEHGAIDMIIDRREMKNQLVTLITLLTKQSAVAEIEAA